MNWYVVLGHRLDSQYAFFDQLLVEDKDTFRHFGFSRTPDEELSQRQAIQILNNSPLQESTRQRGTLLRPGQPPEGNSKPDQRHLEIAAQIND